MKKKISRGWPPDPPPPAILKVLPLKRGWYATEPFKNCLCVQRCNLLQVNVILAGIHDHSSTTSWITVITSCRWRFSHAKVDTKTWDAYHDVCTCGKIREALNVTMCAVLRGHQGDLRHSINMRLVLYFLFLWLAILCYRFTLFFIFSFFSGAGKTMAS